MGKKRSATETIERQAALRHVLVVGGTTREWADLGEELWAMRRSDLAKVVAHAGAMWLTMRPFSGSVELTPADVTVAEHMQLQRVIDVREGCTVIVDPSADGRQRFLEAIDRLRDIPVDAIDEAAIAAVLMAPAPVEPDLTVILGPREHLPPSLVWELAYSEIVSVDAHWNDLAAAHVEHAIDEFSRRHRRFGGLE